MAPVVPESVPAVLAPVVPAVPVVEDWPVVTAESQLPVVEASVPGPPAVTDVLLLPVVVEAPDPVPPPVTGIPPDGIEVGPELFAEITLPPHPITSAAIAIQTTMLSFREILIKDPVVSVDARQFRARWQHSLSHCNAAGGSRALNSQKKVVL